jgi:hypothetical protein
LPLPLNACAQNACACAQNACACCKAGEETEKTLPHGGVWFTWCWVDFVPLVRWFS